MNYLPDRSTRYFEEMLARKDWKLRGVRPRKCCDCPIDDMYREIAEALAWQDKDLIRRQSETWFCHTSPDLACRGNWDFQGLD